MNDHDKTALEHLAQQLEMTRYPALDSDEARDTRIMVTIRLAQLARDIRAAITEDK